MTIHNLIRTGMGPGSSIGLLVKLGFGGVTVPLTTQVTGVANVFDEFGVAESGVKIYCRMILPPPSVGNIFDNAIRESISSGGVVSISRLFKGAVYEFWRGRSSRVRKLIPSDASDPYNIGPVLGNDSTDPCIT